MGNRVLDGNLTGFRRIVYYVLVRNPYKTILYILCRNCNLGASIIWQCELFAWQRPPDLWAPEKWSSCFHLCAHLIKHAKCGSPNNSDFWTRCTMIFFAHTVRGRVYCLVSCYVHVYTCHVHVYTCKLNIFNQNLSSCTFYVWLGIVLG